MIVSNPIILNCPFCGGKASIFSQYDSDDYRPDGNKWFVICDECGAEGSKFYARDISSMHLNETEIEKQNEARDLAIEQAITCWNKRV